MGRNRILADSDDHNILCLELLVACSEGAGLPGAARCIVLWIEIEDNLFACKIRQTDGVAIFIQQVKIRCFHSHFQHRAFSFVK